jgi:enoyl-CoA hydratase
MQSLTIERRDDGTALITIARPDKLGAMDHAFFHELTALMNDMDKDDTVRAAVITGAGRAFSAGGDIADFNRISDLAGARRQVKLALESFLAVERAETVVIAAVNGLAFGGGVELTLCCDVALAGVAARFAFTEVTLGLMPGYGLVRGPQVIGRAWTHRLALSGDVFDAEAALQMGLVQEVVPDSQLVSAALGLAARIAEHPPMALRVMKRFINRGAPAGISESIEATAVLMASQERAESTAAFAAR